MALSDFEGAFEAAEHEIVRAMREDGKRSWGHRELLELFAQMRQRFARDESAIEQLFRLFGPELEEMFTHKLFAQMLDASGQPDQPATTEDPAEAGPAAMPGESGHRRSTPDGEESTWPNQRPPQQQQRSPGSESPVAAVPR